MITTADERVAWERHLACRTALEFIVRGYPALAHTTLMDSLARQARWSGEEFELRPVYQWPAPEPTATILPFPEGQTCYGCIYYATDEHDAGWCIWFDSEVDEYVDGVDCGIYE